MLPKLYYITQPVEGVSYTRQVEQACRGGVKLVQLRLKDTLKDEMLRIAREVKSVTDSYSTLLIINDNPEVAVQVGASGVHLGMNDVHPELVRKAVGKDMIIGGTANTFERIMELQQYADYFGVGPFRFTYTKKNLAPILGLEGYVSILQQMQKHAINKPVFAIGGIEESDFPTLMKTGIHGIAVSSVISKSVDITQTALKLINTLN